MLNQALEVIRLSFLLLLFCCHYQKPFGNGVQQDDQLTLHRFDDLPSGPLEDATCNIENVEEANQEELNKLLKELTNRTFFRLFKVDLSVKCPFWKSTETAKDLSCGSEEKPTATSKIESSNPFGAAVGGEKEKPSCSLETSRGTKLPWGPVSSPVIKSSFVQDNISEGCKAVSYTHLTLPTRDLV